MIPSLSLFNSVVFYTNSGSEWMGSGLQGALLWYWICLASGTSCAISSSFLPSHFSPFSYHFETALPHQFSVSVSTRMGWASHPEKSNDCIFPASLQYTFEAHYHLDDAVVALLTKSSCHSRVIHLPSRLLLFIRDRQWPLWMDVLPYQPPIPSFAPSSSSSFLFFFLLLVHFIVSVYTLQHPFLHTDREMRTE